MDRNTLPSYNGEYILSPVTKPAHSGPELCKHLPETAFKLAKELILRRIELRRLQMKQPSFGINNPTGYELRMI